MNILFLTISNFNSIEDRGIYSDLMRRISKEGHTVFVVCPNERRYKESTKLIFEKDNFKILRVKTFNIKKTNNIERGISTLLIQHQFKKAIKKFFDNTKFDIIIYSTPPITFTGLIKYFKHRDNAKTYLLLKDIFPQNAIDLKMLKQGSLLYKYFRKKEKRLYAISDKIGCMSPANVKYLCVNNPEIDASKVHVNPNSIEIDNANSLKIKNDELLKKYNIPEDSLVFIYGGNLGKPQGINFLVDVLKEYYNNEKVFFFIAGSGTEFNFLNKWFAINRPINSVLLSEMPKFQYNNFLRAADVGLILLDPHFTIPNFPSRLLSYLEFSMPIIAATDRNTDIGIIAQENGFGFWCEHGDIQMFKKHVDFFVNNKNRIVEMGEIGREFLINNYSVDVTYSNIFI